jgi:hypothetical protein
VSTSQSRPVATGTQRRSQRVMLAVPLLISGKRFDNTPFSERTATIVVNAHGALLVLHEPVRVGQALMVKNLATSEKIGCKVADMNVGSNGVVEVGVEFSVPNPHFWRVSFPPTDWSPRSPEAKRIGQ